MAEEIAYARVAVIDIEDMEARYTEVIAGRSEIFVVHLGAWEHMVIVDGNITSHLVVPYDDESIEGLPEMARWLAKGLRGVPEAKIS